MTTKTTTNIKLIFKNLIRAVLQLKIDFNFESLNRNAIYIDTGLIEFFFYHFF